jgi:hypothetical protein
MRLLPAVFALGTVLVAGCQDPDVGGPCTFYLPGLDTGAVAADYLETGKTECDNLVCIKSPPPPAGSRVKNNPYCSKPCVATNDCSPSDTGLECRDVVLDETFLNALPPDIRAKYLPPGVQNAKYCAAPVPR